jgi:hypothetical protein
VISVFFIPRIITCFHDRQVDNRKKSSSIDFLELKETVRIVHKTVLNTMMCVDNAVDKPVTTVGNPVHKN